ncbi:MAG: radical SAM protein [Synergistaceae bacterium]|nr:radical SAM protein [Synergistaceae bacterium]
MKYTPPVYRPPFEDGSLLLQASIGCSHNKCTFCSMYQGVKFQAESLEQIKQDLIETRDKRPWYKRVFLLGGDPFALSAERLKAIAQMTNNILPNVKTISMYASINNIKNKTDEELEELRALNINDFNIGFETALDDLLKYFNKGFDLTDAREQLTRLKKFNYDFSLNIIIGAAGMQRSLENAIANSEFLNEIQPSMIFVGTMHMDKNTQLRAERDAGLFTENTIKQNIIEEIELLKRLDLQKSYFYGRHVSNLIPVWGNLPDDKQAMLNELIEGIGDYPEDFLNSTPEKGAEGVTRVANPGSIF